MAAFETFLDMESLREVMTSATGKGVKVAILDTGVEGPDRLTFEGPNFPMPDIEQSFDLLWKRIKGVAPAPDGQS